MVSPIIETKSNWRGIDKLAFAYNRPNSSAIIKQKFSDFKVNEHLGFDLAGSGEHLYLQVKKTNLSTVEVAKKLAETLQERVSNVGYSGMKDKHGECTQWFSVPVSESKLSALSKLEEDNLQILSFQKNNRKLKIGSHKLNKFDLVLRNCQGTNDDFDFRLGQVKTKGIPNYFGSQRFGNELTNLDQLSTLVLDSQFGAAQNKKRFKRSMVISAARAYIFNQVLSERVLNKNWDQYVSGDVLNLNGTDRSFKLESEPWTEEFEQRLREFDIHITGPLVGQIDPKDKYASSIKAADIEIAVFKQFETISQSVITLGIKASRRPLRFVPENLNWKWLDDQTLRLQFALRRGAYATSLLREVCVI